MAQLRGTFRPEILLVAIVALTLLRPGDAAWINDEPIMMEMAIRYNGTGSNLYGLRLPFTPSPYGLVGTHGRRYGPLPIWLDQCFLIFTSDLKVMLACRAAIFSSITALALYCLARTMRLSSWYSVLSMLSPWLWMYSRSLWDSTWCIPLSAGLFSAYAGFLFCSRRWTFQLSIACGLLLPMVHLMSLAIVLPIALHLLVFRRRELYRWKWDALAILAIWAYLFWPYLAYSFSHQEAIPWGEHSAWMGWLFPLLGGHFLTLGIAGRVPDDGWQMFAPDAVIAVFTAARWVTRMALVFVWLGMILATARAWKAIRRSDADALDHLCLLAIAAWIFQTVLDGVQRVYASPHYYSATWIVFVFFAWIAIDWTQRHVKRTVIIPALAAYAGCLICGVVIIATTIAQNAGTRGILYGTSIGNQIETVREIRRFSAASLIDIEYPNWKEFPLAMKVLMELNPPGAESRPPAHLVVRYRGADPADAHLEVRQK